MATHFLRRGDIGVRVRLRFIDDQMVLHFNKSKDHVSTKRFIIVRGGIVVAADMLLSRWGSPSRMLYTIHLTGSSARNLVEILVL